MTLNLKETDREEKRKMYYYLLQRGLAMTLNLKEGKKKERYIIT